MKQDHVIHTHRREAITEATLRDPGIEMSTDFKAAIVNML